MPGNSRDVYARLDAGTLKLLYVAPERFANEAFRQRLKRLPIQLAAIDEAHCISEWGHNFRPDYLKLAKICRRLKIPRVLCLTATATPKVARDIRKAFRIATADHVQLSFHRANLDLRVTPCAAAERKTLLLEKLTAVDGPAVVYVTRQETAEEVATFLAKNGLSVRAYHAGLPAEFRADAQSSFMAGDTRVIVATIAFGMGIDKANIRAVFHYNLPKSLENHTQEIGRAGRDGQPADLRDARLRRRSHRAGEFHLLRHAVAPRAWETSSTACCASAPCSTSRPTISPPSATSAPAWSPP